MSKKMPKENEYSLRIISALADTISNEDSEHYIPLDELMEDDNLTAFAHALGNIAPSFMLEQMSPTFKGDMLHYHSIMTRLLFQFMQQDKS